MIWIPLPLWAFPICLSIPVICPQGFKHQWLCKKKVLVKLVRLPQPGWIFCFLWKGLKGTQWPGLLSVGWSLANKRVKTPTDINTFSFSFNLFLGSRNSQSCLNELNFTGGFPKVQPPVIKGDIEFNLEKASLRQFCSWPQDYMSILEIGTWDVAQEWLGSPFSSFFKRDSFNVFIRDLSW